MLSGAQVEKDQCKSVEIRELTDTERFTSHVLYFEDNEHCKYDRK